MKRGIFFILLSLFCTFSAQAQLETKGTDFWLAFAKTYIYDQPDNLIFEIKIVADEAATGTIKYTSLSNITIPFTISAGGVFTHTLSLTERNAVYNATYGITISNKSIHIESDVPVSVYAINLVNHLAGDAIADATNVLPTSVLGTEYYHAGRISDDPAGTRNKFDQNLIIVTQNGTNIYQNGKEIGTNLSAGAVYYNQFAPNKDITGARITSNKPVAYFSAHNFCQISGGGDNFFQQLTPVNTWGKKFMVPVTSRGIELIRIVASQDNTTITQTGGTITTKYGGKNSLTLDAGQWVELEIKLSSNGCYIQSDKPVQVCSYMVGGAYPGAINTIGGDESICWVPPVEQRLNSVLISPFVMSNFNRHYALIVTPTATKNNTTVSIGGAPAVGLSGGTWYDNSDSGMSFYNVELSNSSVAYTYSNNSGVIVYAYGFGVAISYYYMAGSAARPLEVNCLEEGTLLYKQDFGGNDVNDPPFAKLPFSCGFTEVPFSATGPKGESYYNLVKNAHNVYPGEFWADNYDHTYPEDPDRGYMMVVHPVCSITPPPRTGQVVYGTHIGGLCDGVTLSFSAWLTDVNDKGESFGGKHPIVEMIVLDKITGDTLKSSGIIEVPHGKVWTRYSFDFELPQGVDSITFKILNKQPAFQGNDLGIDDIEIRLCTPPVLTTLPDVIEECKGSATTLYASYTDDGIFGNELSYRWERSLDGNINNPSGWLVVPGSQGSVPTGIVSSLFTMPLLKASDAGYYRFVVGKVSSINKWACRAASKVIELKVNALSSIGEIKIPAAICVNDTVVASAPFSVQGNSWLSSNPEVATIDAVTGKIIGIQDGRVMISCIVSDGICTDTLRTLLEVDFCLDCSEGGTVLYRQDFGGNSPSDPYTSPTGFSPENSDLLYSTVNIHQTHERGYYTLTKNPYYIYKEGFHSITDHTHPEDTTRGYMMFVDPYTNDYDRILYQTEIHDLCAETKLYFSAWFTDINRYVHLKAVRPKIELQMIDFDTEAVLASSGIMVLDSGNFWSRIGIPFTTGATSSSIIFRIYNKEQSKDGNDWAMDDIEIRLCANPVVTELAPEGVEICENQPFTLSGTYTDAGTFGKNLSYRWEYSTTGDINTLSDWDSVPGSSGTVTNGRVVSSYTIDSLTAGRAGFYRLAVSTAAQIEGSYCRAISEPVELKVKNSGISAIGGDSTVCEGNTITLTNAVTGGTWISSNPEIATVDIISGEVMGISAGSVEISYKVENNGCTGTTSTIIAVASSPNAGTISEVSSVCERSSVILTSSVAGGTWASVHPEVATVNEWGVLTGVSAGVAKIVYSVTQNGCTDTTSVNITVIAFPDAGEIEIPAAICVNDTVIASTSTPVQNTTWLSSNPEIAKIDAATGKLIGIQDGSVMISCILSNGICTDTLRTLLEVDFCLDCSEGGTVLYRQDFGGNSPSDPHTANEGFPKEHSELWYSKTTTHGAPHFRGYYNLTKDPEYVYPEGFYSINDHTHFGDPYRGYMMFIDPFTDDNGKILYQTEIHDLCAETKLYFSAWFTDLNKYVHAKAERPIIEMQMIDFATNEILVTTDTMTLPKGNKWTQIGIPFTTGATSSSIIFRIYNRQGAKDGNDWAMDDIEIRLCANPVITEPAPGVIEICENDPFTLSGTYTDAGTFGKNLSYRWEYSTTGDINILSDWDSVPGSSGTVTNGRVVSSYTIDSLTAGRAGFYRLAVSTAAQIEGTYCRAISEPVELKLRDFGMSAIGGDHSVCKGGTTTLTNAATGGTWTSSNLNIATIDAVTGVVTGVNAGMTEITYTIADATCEKRVSRAMIVDWCTTCSESGTLLFKQDFGGNDPNDPPTSELAFVDGYTQVPFSAVGPQGQSYYSLAKNANDVYSGEFHHAYDHTHPDDPTRGYLMVVHPTHKEMNGAIDQIIYQTDIDSLCDGMKLSFSAWFMDVNSLGPTTAYPPIIQIQIINIDNGAIIYRTDNITIYKGNYWTRHGFEFELPDGITSVRYRILNKQGRYNGNDLGIDDIEIRLCTPPVITAPLPNYIETCAEESLTLSGTYVDNGIFGYNLSYRWEHSLTGSVNSSSGWTVVAGSEGVVDNGVVISSYPIDSLTTAHTGFYRLVVGTAASIHTHNCRAASEIIELKVRLCATVRGTVFPFVYYEEPEVANLFPIVARLYDTALISQGPLAILNAEPIRIDTAIYYDGTEFIPGTPKYPGYIGRLDNPNFPPINWAALGYTVGKIDTTFLLAGELPQTAIGWYQFEDLESGVYVLVLSRGGYVTRFAKIKVHDPHVLAGHKELILGDMNGDFKVDEKDIAIMLSKISQYGDSLYDAFYDVNGDLRINAADISLLNFYLHFFFELYKDAEECFKK